MNRAEKGWLAMPTLTGWLYFGFTRHFVDFLHRQMTRTKRRRQSTRPALSAILARKSVAGFRLNHGQIDINPFGIRTFDPEVMVALGKKLGMNSLLPFVGIAVEAGSCKAKVDHRGLLSAAQVNLLSQTEV